MKPQLHFDNIVDKSTSYAVSVTYTASLEFNTKMVELQMFDFHKVIYTSRCFSVALQNKMEMKIVLKN